MVCAESVFISSRAFAGMSHRATPRGTPGSCMHAVPGRPRHGTNTPENCSSFWMKVFGRKNMPIITFQKARFVHSYVTAET